MIRYMYYREKYALIWGRLRMSGAVIDEYCRKVTRSTLSHPDSLVAVPVMVVNAGYASGLLGLSNARLTAYFFPQVPLSI